MQAFRLWTAGQCLRTTRPCWRQLSSIPRRFHTPTTAPMLSGRTTRSSKILISVRPLGDRFFNVSAPALPVLAPPAVGRWLLASSALVFAIIIVGGVTRLTESGLSITEWRPITGILPPLSENDWAIEFAKYQASPEFKILNHAMTVDEFKFIFFMEWGHRILGRVIGLGFVLPLTYFAARRKVSPKLSLKLAGMALLIGFQGALGWYMVQSGLEEESFKEANSIPRVSQYRLAAHLGTALVLYFGMLRTGLSVLSDYRFGSTQKPIPASIGWNTPALKTFTRASWVLTGLVFLTALSGAFVAGLDAGLVYNEFPYMGGRLVPHQDELFAPAYSKKEDGSDLYWRNILENPTTTQFDHRLLATTTYTAVTGLYLSTLLPTVKAVLPQATRRAVVGALAAVNLQVVLGISTLLYLVPVPLAAAHQAGSVVLLSAMTVVLATLRRPGFGARLWRQAQRTTKS